MFRQQILNDTRSGFQSLVPRNSIRVWFRIIALSIDAGTPQSFVSPKLPIRPSDYLSRSFPVAILFAVSVVSIAVGTDLRFYMIGAFFCMSNH